MAQDWSATQAVLGWIDRSLRPAIAACGTSEIASLLTALDGRFVRPGPSGAPSRGRPDVLPTGRNFFAVDVRAVPSEAAWRTGRAAAERLVERYWQDEGEWVRSVVISCWGTANMRTSGEDIAQAMALIGARPVWESGSGRVVGFQIISAMELARPRVDVTLRISGLFRDAFPVQIDLFDSAIRAIAALDESDEDNPIAAHVRSEADAGHRTITRIFGSNPGSYGSGIEPLLDRGDWQNRAELGHSFARWSGFAYGGGQEGMPAPDLLERGLSRAEMVVQSQDNREHDILDSSEYHQFMGGLSSAIESLSGTAPRSYHLDTSRPEAPLPRSLSEEVSRVVRGRAANPKWLAGIMRHGYRGAAEIAGNVDYLFGFAATTDAVKNHHFDQLFSAYLEDETVRAFLNEANAAALRAIAERFGEAIRRDLWQPRSNQVADILAACGHLQEQRVPS